MNDSPLSPEAVAQMVADLRAADKPLIQSGPFIQTRERLRTAADMLTTLAAENAALRASEAAARDRVNVLTEALTFYAQSHIKNPNEGPWGMTSMDFGTIARQALTPTSNGETP